MGNSWSRGDVGDLGGIILIMSEYLHWDRKTIDDFSENNTTALYNQGYLFTRRGRGTMDQTRSLRVDLSVFEPSSENRRILKKTNAFYLLPFDIPFSEYQWHVGKMAKDFYETKFGKGTFSANKAKELLTDKNKSNFNTVFVYTNNWGPDEWGQTWKDTNIGADGFAICYENDSLIHYAYPFYRTSSLNRIFFPNLGMGMMMLAIMHAKEKKKKYIYLGSFQRPADVYKLQFAGLEWWNGKEWERDLEKLKEIAKE